MPVLTPLEAREHVLAYTLEEEPRLRSPYAIDGHPPMWIVARLPDNTIVAARPARVQAKVSQQWQEVDGVAYHLRRDGDWHGQGMKTDWDHFAAWLSEMDATLISLKAERTA